MRQEGYTPLVDNIGYVLLKVPQDVLDELKISVDEIQNNFTNAIPYNTNLAGQIDKEYQITLAPKATNYVRYAVDQYNKANPHYHVEKQSILGKVARSSELSKMEFNGEGWINFQSKYEYNPMHTHSGLFSFVIWYQIPFYKEDEVKYGAGKFKAKHHLNSNGEFVFFYGSGELIKTCPMEIDKHMEGYMAVFPSSLNHAVYPFYTSDDYRITISGNIYLHG